MKKVAAMNYYFRMLGLVLAWTLLPTPTHAAWTNTAATGLHVTPAGDHPRGIAVHPGRRLGLVANQDADTVSLINLDTGNATATISVAAKPRDVVVDTVNSRAYVLHETESLSTVATVSVIDLVSQTRTAQWTFTGEFRHPLLNSAGTELWLADEEGKRLLRVSTVDGAVLQTLTLTYEPQALAFSADGNTLLVGTETGGVRLVSAATWLETHSIATKKVKSLAWWPNGSLAVAVIDDRNLLLLDLNTRTVAGSIAFGGEPGNVTLHNDIAYIAHKDNNTVSAINLASRTLLGRYRLGFEPHGLAIDPSPLRLLASLPKDDQLLKLDPAQATLTPVVLLADKLKDIAVNNTTDQAVALPDKERAYIINLIDKTTTELTLPAKPTAVGIDTAHGTALLGFDKKQGLRFLDLASKALLPNIINLDQEPTAIAVDPTRHLAVVVVDKKDQLLIVDTNTRTLLSTLNTKGKFMDVAVHSGRGKAYVVNQEKDTGEIVVLDLATRTVTGIIAVTKHAQSLVIDEALDRAVVAIEEQDKLEVVDLQTNRVIASYPLTKHPRSLALNPMTHIVVVAAKDSDQIALLNLNTSTVTPNFAPLEKPLRVAVTTRYNQALAVSSEKGEILFIPLPNPEPTLTELVPNSTPQTTSLTILATGDQFIDGVSKLVINGQFVTTRWKDAQHLEADVLPTLLATSGAYPVKVVNAAPGGGESQTLTFTVLNPAPILTNVTPASLPANSTDQTITLTGDKFITASQVFFGAQALATTYVSATQLKATVPGTLLTTGGQVPVTVFNPAPGGGTSAPFTVTVIGAKPTITGFTPTEGPVGTQVTITGTNFDALNPGSNTVKFNGISAVVASATETQLKAIVPTTASTGTISVTTKGGTATSTDVFTVKANQDFDLSLTPASLQIPINGYGTTRVKLVSQGLTQYTQLVSLNVTGLPAGITAKLDRPNVYLNQDTLVTLINDGSAAPGTYTVNLTGNGLSDVLPLTRPKTLTVQVLEASATTVTGRVLNAKDDAPMAGVRARLGTQTTYTDATGSYRFLNPNVIGDQVVLIDGGVLNTTAVEYPSSIPSPVMVQANQDNLALTTYLTGIDPTKFTRITPGAETHVTNPEIPNYELRIPQGAVLYGWDGTPIDKVNVRIVPVDRLPIKPLPAGVNAKSVYLYYFFREGGANPTRPIPVTMNNDLDALPGEKVDLWYYDESPTPDPNSNQWRIMGTGTVTADGKSIVSDPGVGIPKFCCGATTASNPAPPPPPPDCPKAGNPVSLSSGAATVFEEKSFGIQGGKFPVSLSCGYSSVNPTIGFFGRGTYFNYDWRVQQSAQAITVISPNGTRYNLSQGTDGVYRMQTGRSNGLGMEARITSGSVVLTRKNGTVYEFDTRGFLTAQQDPSGNRITIARDSNNYATSLTDANGRTYSVATTRISIGRTIYTVATQITDPLGRTQKYTYDTQARLLSVTDTLNQSTGYSYDSLGRIFQKTDARGAITQYEYDSAGRTIKEILPDNSIYQFAYTVVGNTITETKVTNPNGNVTTHRFNGQGVELRRIDALGRIFKKDIDYATNQVTAEYDPLGRAAKYTYDSHGNRTSGVDSQGNTTIIEYDQRWNKPVRITNPLGNTTLMTYDINGNLATTTNPEGETTTFAYNSLGKISSVTNPLGSTVRFDYDAEGNLIKTSDVLGRYVQHYYDNANRLIEIIDARGRSTRFEYDSLNRLSLVSNALSQTVTFVHDAKNNLVTVTDQRGVVAETNAYNLRNQLISRTDALGKSIRYTYDNAGNVIQITDKKGQVSVSSYDALNRVAQIQYADGRTASFTYDLVGNLIRVSDSVSGEVLYTYDDLNRLTSETTNRGVVSYNYDSASRIVERRINGQDPTVYTYDKADRIKTITYRNKTASYSYDSAGRLVGRTHANGVTETYEFSADNALLSITYKKSDGSIIDRISYNYDESGNVTSRNRAALGSVPDSTFTATYDSNNRMLTFNGQPLAYDNNGNLITRQTAQGTITYTWDAQNHLIGIIGPNGTAAFKYDYRGRRIEKTVNGQTVGYLYDGPQAIAELQGSSIGTTYLTGLQIDEVLARFSSQGNRILLADALGSIIALTDDSQTTQTISGYSAYGEQAQAGENSDNSLQYTGRENDNTGLYYYRARYYDPQLKRFISSDPKGLSAGINTYAYVSGNPMRRKDPFGLDGNCWVAKWRGGYIVGWDPCGPPGEPGGPSGPGSDGPSSDDCPQDPFTGQPMPDLPPAPPTPTPAPPFFAQEPQPPVPNTVPQPPIPNFEPTPDLGHCLAEANAYLWGEIGGHLVVEGALEGTAAAPAVGVGLSFLGGYGLGHYADTVSNCMTGKHIYEYVW